MDVRSNFFPQLPKSKYVKLISLLLIIMSYHKHKFFPFFYISHFTILITLAISSMIHVPFAHAVQIVVDAKTNSSSGGVGKDSAIDIVKGSFLTIIANPNEMWSAGSNEPHSRKSNADGIIEYYGKWTQGNLSANYGSLVGRIDKNYFFIGTSFSKKIDVSGRLFLYYWDSNAYDNSGYITVDVTVDAIIPRANITELHFIRNTENGPEEIEEIGYDEQFYIKVEFYSEPEEDEKTVTLDWGEGADKQKKIIVERQDGNPKIYLSDIIYVKRPVVEKITSSKEGE